MRGIIHAQMKTDRAGEHLKRLQEVLTKYRASDPYTITKYDQPEKARHIVRITMNPAPHEIPLSIGEFSYCLRSSLDQLAWQLALRSGRTPSKDTAFPIHRDRDARSEERFRRLTWDMPCDAVQVIRTLQPYERGTDFNVHPLWRLNQLCNLDKHCTMAVASDSVNIHSSGPPINAGRRDFDDGIVCGVEFAIPLALKDEVNFKPEVAETIFGRPIDEPGEPFEVTESQIADIYRFVRDEVIPAFYAFFKR